MKNQKNKVPILFFVIFFIVLSLILPFISFIVAFVESGEAEASKFCDFLFYLANWPNLLLKTYPYIVTDSGEVVYNMGKAFFNAKVILINALGWGLIGFLFGILSKSIFWRVSKIKK